MSFEEEGSLEPESFYEDEINDRSRKEEEDGYVYRREESIKVSFYECYDKNPNDALDYWLKQLSLKFRLFDEVTRKVLKDFVKDLRCRKIDKDFDDFNLGTMSVLNALDEDQPVEEFLSKAYIGCDQCLLCLQYDAKLWDVTQRTGLNNYLLEAMGIMKYVLKYEPDLDSEKTQFKKKLEQLNKLTDEYLTEKGYDSLKVYKVLIKDFKIFSEIDAALRHLRYEFEGLRRRSTDDIVSRHENAFTLFSQMEETTDLSSSCC